MIVLQNSVDVSVNHSRVCVEANEVLRVEDTPYTLRSHAVEPQAHHVRTELSTRGRSTRKHSKVVHPSGRVFAASVAPRGVPKASRVMLSHDTAKISSQFTVPRPRHGRVVDA